MACSSSSQLLSTILHALLPSQRDSFVADICRCFCEICASLLIKNCVYLHICIPCHAPHSPPSTLSLHLSSDSVCLLSVARSLNVATSSKIRRACPLPSLPQLGSMRHADLALISRDFNESRLTSQKAKPEPCNLRRAPCTLNPDPLLMTSLIRAKRAAGPAETLVRAT